VADLRAAVDTSVVVNFLCGGAENDDPRWLSHSTWVFEAHEAGDFHLVVPTIVIAEVAGCGQVRGDHLSRQVRRDRIKLATDWIQRGDFIPAEVTLDVAIRAAELAIEFQLAGADATVLSVAETYGCAWLFTWTRSRGQNRGLNHGHLEVPEVHGPNCTAPKCLVEALLHGMQGTRNGSDLV